VSGDLQSLETTWRWPTSGERRFGFFFFALSSCHPARLSSPRRGRGPSHGGDIPGTCLRDTRGARTAGQRLGPSPLRSGGLRPGRLHLTSDPRRLARAPARPRTQPTPTYCAPGSLFADRLVAATAPGPPPLTPRPVPTLGVPASSATTMGIPEPLNS
jgi:hypothetical protein